MKKRVISLLLCLIMLFSVSYGVMAAGSGATPPPSSGSGVTPPPLGPGGLVGGTIEDFYNAINSIYVNEIYGSAVDIDADIKVSVNGSPYEDDKAVFYDGTHPDLKFIAHIDMTEVRNKYLDYIRWSDDLLAIDPGFEDFFNDINVIGAIQIDIIFPKDLADEINLDLGNPTSTGYKIVHPVNDMDGFDLVSTNSVPVTDVYTEINPADPGAGINRIWAPYSAPAGASHGEGEYHLLITVYPKSPLSTVGNILPLTVGDLREGIGAPYAPYDYRDYLGDLELEFDEHMDIPHDGVTFGTVYGNVEGYTEYVSVDSSTQQITTLSETKYSAVQKVGEHDELSNTSHEHNECDIKSKQISATYEILGNNTKKIVFHVNGTYLKDPAENGVDYTGVVAPVYGNGSILFDPMSYTTIPDKVSNYNFLGWSTDTTEANIISTETTFTANVTDLYAIFEAHSSNPTTKEPITLHYIIDGKSDVIKATTDYAPIKVKLSNLDVPVVPGFRFDGWYEDGSYRNKVSDVYTTSVSTSIYGRYVKVVVPEELVSDDHFAYIIGYPEGDVRPLNNITREEIAAIFYRLLKDEVREELAVTTNDFSDVSEPRWSNKEISTMANGGYIKGYADGTFRPGNYITRAEFATIAARFLGDDAETDMIFTDISGHWAENYIGAVANSHWVNGYEDGTFRPDSFITRAEAIAIINRMLVRYVNKDGIHADAIQWPDNHENAWYYYDMLEATSSHHYVRQTDGIHEIWTMLKPNKVW